jgi:RNA polymerase sigma-70 factor (ECF subfamily)
MAQGDLKGFEQAYLSYRDEFIMWANKNYYCDFEEARDVYQATVIQFYENVQSGKLTKLTSDLKTYLFAIGKNKIRELRDSGRRFREMQDRYEVTEDEDKVEKEVLFEQLESSLEALGNPCKRMLELYYYYKKSLTEIAETLEYKNSDTVKNLKYKCLGRLRKLYRQN